MRFRSTRLRRRSGVLPGVGIVGRYWGTEGQPAPRLTVIGAPSSAERGKEGGGRRQLQEAREAGRALPSLGVGLRGATWPLAAGGGEGAVPGEGVRDRESASGKGGVWAQAGRRSWPLTSPKK